ncbi:MAG: YjbH domain-containing protein [Pseudomonadota bacterium]
MRKSKKTYLSLSVCVAFSTGGAGALSAQSIPPEQIFAVRDRPTLNFYGSSGLIDMPSGESLPDGEIAIGISNFAGMTRSTFTFQASPRLSFSFRYVGLRDANIGGFETYRDRSFDARFLINKESRLWPAITVGLQDFAGTGIYAAEYIAATKTFQGGARIPGTFKVTAGLGWGRLGSSGSIGAPLGRDRNTFTDGDTGGELSFDQWFRGPMAPFAGVEWQYSDRLGFKVEYSSDAYNQEDTVSGIFTRKSRFNFGAEYQYSDRVRIGAYYLYGSEFGINLQYLLNPTNPPALQVTEAVAPVSLRPSRAENPQAWETNWASAPDAPARLRTALKPQLEANGLAFEALSVDANSAELRYRNTRYQATAIAIGRAARVMAATLPASVETFRIVTVENGLAQSAVTIRRSDLEALEFDPQAADALLAVTGIGEAAPQPQNAIFEDEFYPDFAWSIGPYVSTSYFDPDEPVRADAGLKLEAAYRPAPGWTLGGELRYRLTGNIGSSPRLSNSQLERVRTNGVLYARETTSLENLYASYQWKPSEDLYARVTAGYLERMFGGVSAELLWKPVGSRLALGVEANYVKQRDFSGLGFQDYGVATGHASAYYEFSDQYHAQVDVGRYLAGDIGATMTFTREFANGVRIGGFFTLTNVSSEEFGEGSFDKGINIELPLSFFLGNPSKRTVATTIRPIQRDGGARLAVPGRLYSQVRSGHRRALESNWSRVWE